jgi:hypothetical protein
MGPKGPGAGRARPPCQSGGPRSNAAPSLDVLGYAQGDMAVIERSEGAHGRDRLEPWEHANQVRDVKGRMAL